jgi:hypothetical protein
MSKRATSWATRRIYQFIKAHRYEYDIQLMCRSLEVSRSGYYEWHASRLIEPSSCVSAPWGATVVSRNDRVTFRADLTVRARKHTDKSGLLKIGGAPNSAEIHYLTVAPGSHNAEVEGSSPSLTTIKPRSVPGVTPIFESSIRRDDKPDYDVGVAR